MSYDDKKFQELLKANSLNSLVVDDVVGEIKKKKRIKSGSKGKRAERQVVDRLNERFHALLEANPKWGEFSRSIGSGNRWGQNVKLSQAANSTFSGDISPPSNFKFVIESKSGYNDIDLACAFEGGVKTLDDFLQQVTDDSSRSGRKPILIWRKDRKPRLAFLKSGEIPADKELNFHYTMKYRDWTGYLFEDVLTLDDGFFFQLEQTAL